MAKKKKSSLVKKKDVWSYNDTFDIDMNRFVEVVEKMLPIYKQNEQAYKDFLLFPEFVFKDYFF